MSTAVTFVEEPHGASRYKKWHVPENRRWFPHPVSTARQVHGRRSNRDSLWLA